ncbi:hypothetical protein HY024_03685 [Candidatus Curtissbacteria bacterium]|nr:hypothetical protein [Candidatus Curtissbacteria bacterium]
MTTLKNIKKVGLGLTAIMAVLSLFISPMLVLADGPVLVIKYLGSKDGNWNSSVNVNSGETAWFYVEVHNTVVGTTANNVKVRASMPSSTGSSIAFVSADNAGTATGVVNLTVNGGGQLKYVPGSTHMTMDANGDGVKEYNDAQMPDGIVDGGIGIPNVNGCYAYVAQITFAAKVENVTATPTPTPSTTPSPTPSTTPTPTPSTTPSPTPSTTPTPAPSTTPSPAASPSPTPNGGINITNNNSNSNTNNNNINVNNTGSTVASVPLKKTPETGADVLGMFGMFGAAPVGVMLSRYGRGRVFVKKNEEDLNAIANGLVKSRTGKSA